MGSDYRLGVVTALWRRPALAAAVLRHALTLPGVVAVAAARSPEDPEPAPDVPGVTYAEAPNAPLSGKWNAACQALRGRCDGVLVLGSDDFVGPAYVAEAVRLARSGAEVVLGRAVVYVDLATGRACRARVGRPGAGRLLSADVLGVLGWRPWPEGWDRRLDGGQDERVARVLRRPVREAFVADAPGHEVTDVKSAVQMWTYDDVARYRTAALTPDALRSLFAAHYPTALHILTDMAKQQAPKRETADPAPEKGAQTTRRGGTHSAKGAAAREAANAEAQKADAEATGTVRMRAVRNVPAGLTGTDRRVYAGAEFDAPAGNVRRLTGATLAEKV